MPDEQLQTLAEFAGPLTNPLMFQITQGGNDSANEKFFPVTTWAGEDPVAPTQVNFPKNPEEEKR